MKTHLLDVIELKAILHKNQSLSSKICNELIENHLSKSD